MSESQSSFQKLKAWLAHPYRLIWFNVQTFREERAFNINYLRLLLFLFAALALMFLLTLLSFRFTPLGSLFGFNSGGQSRSNEGNASRSQLEGIVLQIDSLSNEIALRDEMIGSLQSLVLGELAEERPGLEGINEEETALAEATDLAKSNTDQMPELIEEGKNIVRTAEALAELQFFVAEAYFKPASPATQKYFSPIRGVVIDSFAPEKGRFGIELQASYGSSVQALEAGTVLWVERNSLGYYSLALQHANNSISIYSGLAESSRRSSDRVRAGDKLGKLPGDASAQAAVLGFQLWFQGHAIDPLRYVLFS